MYRYHHTQRFEKDKNFVHLINLIIWFKQNVIYYYTIYYYIYSKSKKRTDIQRRILIGNVCTPGNTSISLERKP